MIHANFRHENLSDCSKFKLLYSWFNEMKSLLATARKLLIECIKILQIVFRNKYELSFISGAQQSQLCK